MGLLLKKTIDFGNGLQIPQVYIRYKNFHLIGKDSIEIDIEYYASPEAYYNGLKPFDTNKITYATTGENLGVKIFDFIYFLLKKNFPDAVDVLSDPQTANVTISSIEQIGENIVISGSGDPNSEIQIFTYGFQVQVVNCDKKGNFSTSIDDSVQGLRYSLRRLCFISKVADKKISGITTSEVKNFNDPEATIHESVLEASGLTFDTLPTTN